MDWEVLKSIGHWVVYPLVCLLSWFLREQYNEIKTMKGHISDLKIQQAVTESQIRDIRADIQDLILVVREVEKTITEDIKDLGIEIRNGIQHPNSKRRL